VDCSGKRLQETPELHVSLTTLNLGFNNLSVAVPPNSSVWGSHLKFLYLNNNRIKNVVKSDFQELPDLIHVYLDYNLITVIDKHAFEENTKLWKLTLNGNELVVPESTEFLIVPSLAAIELDNCSISDMPFNMFQSMANLVFIRLSNNKIERLDQQMFLHLKKLRHLDLGGNQIKRVFPDIFKTNHRLLWLYLSSNPLDNFNGSHFLRSSSLLSLDISSCNITKIPDKFFSNLHGLISLNLKDNLLKSFDMRAIPQNLESLDISGNSLTHLNVAPETIRRLYSLKHLDLTNNNFTCECRLLALWQWCATLNNGNGGASSCEEFCPPPCGKQEQPPGGKTAPENVHTRMNTISEGTDKEVETSGNQEHNDVENVHIPGVMSGADANDTSGKLREGVVREIGGSDRMWAIITYSCIGVLGGLCLIGVIALVVDGILGHRRKSRAMRTSLSSRRNSFQNVRMELMDSNEDRQETTPLSVQHRFDYVSQSTTAQRNAQPGRSRRS
jgi:Leucine-rich repeat (LRR) protein